MTKCDNNDKKNHVQRDQTNLFKTLSRDNIIAQFINKEKVILNCFKDEDSGRFLVVKRKIEMHRLNNIEMVSALRFRLVIPQEKIIDGTA
jgi:hypothetical protein